VVVAVDMDFLRQVQEVRVAQVAVVLAELEEQIQIHPEQGLMVRRTVVAGVVEQGALVLVREQFTLH
jgi:hypothetical protein